ncbi:hypothetical protein [Veillonella atypica]|uniref:hypothetical protein n=1 Tax=Veillonella atypica TaxID=39777 RepID=UPI001A9F1F34|nr:hypothetical protein [Veillonella atypica]
MNPMVQTIINDAVELAKENAISVLKNLNTEDIHKLVEAEMVSVINPLEDEIKTTSSYWVKIRNRMYVLLLKNSVNSIVKSVENKIRTL